MGWQDILYGRIYVDFSFLTLHKVCTKARLLGERSVRIREVKGSNPSRSTNLPHRFCTMRRFLCLKNFGRPCRAPNPEVGCEPGGVINVLFENPSVSRFFLCILQNAAGKCIAFMPPSRKFLQKFPHHRRLTQP